MHVLISGNPCIRSESVESVATTRRNAVKIITTPAKRLQWRSGPLNYCTYQTAPKIKFVHLNGLLHKIQGNVGIIATLKLGQNGDITVTQCMT